MEINIELLSLRVDEVLYYIWDPIGVSDDPCARSEYSRYVPDILNLLLNSNNVESITNYLDQLTTSHMGLLSNKKECRKTAEYLFKFKNAVKEGLS
jgi:hypothetical protein